MKKLWTLICILALANLMAIAGLVGWLVSSGRLDADRLRAVKVLLGETTAAQKAREAAEAAEAEGRTAAASAEGDRGIALSSAELLSVRLEMSEIDRQRAQMLQRQTQDLRQSLLREIATFESDRSQFLAERQSFEAENRRIAEIDGGRQFRKAVKTLEGLKASDAASLLLALIDGGPAKAPELTGVSAGAAPVDGRELREDGMVRAVAYLNALPDRTRVKIIAEIAKDQPRLAAELLERIRTRGMLDRAPESPRT